MSNLFTKRKFLESEAGKKMRAELTKMTDDPCFNTQSTYTTSSDEKLLFVDKHMNYIASYTNISPEHYLANLKMKTRIKAS